MAKKKPNKLFEAIKNEEIKDNISQNTKEIISNNSNEKIESVEKFFNAQHMSNISNEDKQKLETYEKLIAENKIVYDENAILIEKAAEYSEQREELLKKYEKLESEYNELKKQFDSLQEENDTYLIKISELTFENATLNAKLTNLKSNPEIKQNPVVEAVIDKKPTNNQPIKQYQSRRVSYLNRNNNGYSNWN